MNYNYEQYQKNIEILNRMEKIMKEIGKKNGREECPASFEIKGRDGKLTKVSKEDFAKWMINEKNNDNWVGGVFGLEPKNPEIEKQKSGLVEKGIKDDKKQVEKPKESLVYGAKGDIEGLTYFIERKGPDGVFKESYYEPRSEEEKRQIRKRQEWNKKKREKENSLVVKQEPAKSAVQETNDNQEIKPITSQSSSLTSNSNHHNDSYFGTVTLLVSLLLGVGLIGYGISLVIKKKNKQSR